MSLAETLKVQRLTGWRPSLPQPAALLPYAVPAAILVLWEIAGATG